MKSLRQLYDRYGVEQYYAEHSRDYVNPHHQYVRQLLATLDCSQWQFGIDLACGHGLVSTILSKISWVGVDPYLSETYTQKTGNRCHPVNIHHIASGDFALPKADVIVCSYAFDLFPVSYHNNLLWYLSQTASTLITIRPNKKTIQHDQWKLISHDKCEKSHMQLYETNNGQTIKQ